MSRLKWVLSRDRIYADLSAEIQAHLEEKIEELVAAGMSREEAQAAARRQFGNVTLIEEESREAWQWPRIEEALIDVRYGLRTLWRSRGFTLVAAIALALGIGANTAMFSIVNGVLLRPFSYSKPERLVKLYSNTKEDPAGTASYPNFLDWQRRSRSLEQMAAYRHDTFNLTGQANPERLRGEMASATLFSTLGVEPVVGRTFASEDDRLGAAPVVVLTSSFWTREFGRDARVIGRSLTLNERPYTIVGVVPSDDVVFRRVSVIVPIGQWSEPLLWNRGLSMDLQVVSRLGPGTTARQAQSELDGIAAALAREYPTENRARGISAVMLRDDLVGDVRTPILLLLGAVAFVLLIACSNVASLMLARCTARRREFAIRAALGARRGRIVRQLLTEGVLLAAIGGVLALGVAVSLNAIFVSRLAREMPRADQIRLDASVLAFTALVSIASSLLFTVAPALRSSRPNANGTLRETGRGNTGTHGLQRAMVVVEVALALVLTVSAGLMIRTMARLFDVNPGFDPHDVLTFGTGSSAVHGEPRAVRNGLVEEMERIRAVPGVQGVSVSLGSLPMSSDSEIGYWVEGRPKPTEQSQMAQALFYAVDADYLGVMRIPLVRGRFVRTSDTEKTLCAVVVDEELTRSAFPGQDPLGQRVNFDLIPLQCEIVGVVGHVKQWGLDADALSPVHSQIYIPFRQFPDSVMDMASTGADYVVRTSADPYTAVAALRRAVAGINGKMALYGEQSMEEVVSDSLVSRRLTRFLLVVFAAVALLLAGVGIYGVVSYVVTQSAHDIGIRMALGASAPAVLGMVLGDALRMALLGVGIGTLGAYSVTRAMKGLLFGISATDPLTFAAVTVVLLAVALVASSIPARRAMRVDPMEALRYE